MSANKSLTLTNHKRERRTEKKIHRWINKLSDYDYLKSQQQEQYWHKNRVPKTLQVIIDKFGIPLNE